MSEHLHDQRIQTNLKVRKYVHVISRLAHHREEVSWITDTFTQSNVNNESTNDQHVSISSYKISPLLLKTPENPAFLMLSHGFPRFLMLSHGFWLPNGYCHVWVVAFPAAPWRSTPSVQRSVRRSGKRAVAIPEPRSAAHATPSDQGWEAMVTICEFKQVSHGH